MNHRAYKRARARIIRSRYKRFSDDRHWKRVIATIEAGIKTGNATATKQAAWRVFFNGASAAELHFHPLRLFGMLCRKETRTSFRPSTLPHAMREKPKNVTPKKTTILLLK